MKTMADLKRAARIGIIFAAYWPEIGSVKIRKIEHVQSNAVRFDTGSWFYFPKASECEFIQGCFIQYSNPAIHGFPSTCKTPNIVYCEGNFIPPEVQKYCDEMYAIGAANERREWALIDARYNH